MTSIMDVIKKAKAEELKEENWKNERIMGRISAFDYGYMQPRDL